MLQYILRFAKRFAVLVPGIIIAYFSVRNIFPYFDTRLPLALAIFITYVLGAYVLVPGAIRVVRIFNPPKHLPLYCVTPDGFASDPLNVGILSTRRELILVMEKAGWQVADARTLSTISRLILSTAFERPYPTAPMSSLYLFGRKQDIAFEKPIDGDASAGTRHHVRFWATTFEAKKKLSIRSIHWQHRKTHVFGDSLLWVGAASRDIGVSFIRHNMQVTHNIDPNTDQERELIIKQLRKEKVVKDTQTIKLGQPYRLINRVWNGSLHTDGKMTIVSLKKITKGLRNRSHNLDKS